MESLCYYCMKPTMKGKTCSVCGKPAPVFSRDKDAGILPPGTELDDGSVVIGAPIGRGGFGITYRALDRESGKRVALKEFMPNHLVTRLPDGRGIAVVGGNEEIYLESMRGFMREAKVLNELRRHPNIVKVLFSLEENNTAYYGMQYLEGDNLAAWSREHYPKELMSIRDACVLLLPVMDALSYCHSKGVLHRDISPDNILICEDDPGKPQPKLIDFGAAYVAIQDFTHTFPNVRKAYFSAPEQMSSSSADQGTWSDVYSLCATIYYLITGKPPTSAIDVLAGTGRLKPPREEGARLSEKAEDILLRGMMMDYRKRYQTVQAFREDLCRELRLDYKEFVNPEPKPSEPIPEPVSIPVPAPAPKPEPELVPQPAPQSEPQASESAGFPEENPARSGKSILIRALVYGFLALVLYGSGFYLLGFPGLPAGWAVFAVVLMISLLCSGSSPGMALAGLRFTVPKGSGKAGRMIGYALLNASPLGFIDGMLLFEGKEALCARICGLKCVSRNAPEPSPKSIPEPVTLPRPSQAPPPKPKSEPLPVSKSRPSEMRTAAILKGIDGPMKGRILTVYDTDVLGRNPQMAQVVVGSEDGTVGRAHCRFVYAKRKGKWGVVNQSANGVMINGMRIDEQNGTPVVIPEGARITIGRSTYEFTGNQK